MRYLVAGNGILGLSTAFRLTQQMGSNDSIVIVAPEARQYSATLPAAAMQNSFAEIEVGALDSEKDLYRFELSHWATRMWPEFEKELIEAAGNDIPYGCSKCEVFRGGCFGQGTYVVNNTAMSEVDDLNFAAMISALDDFNEQYEYVDPKSIPNYYPEERYRATQAILIHNEGWFNPRLMLEKLEAILNRHPRVQFINSTVEQLVGDKSSVIDAKLGNGDMLSADYFVLAVGATISDILGASPDVPLNVQPVFHNVGSSMEIKSSDYPHSKCIRTVNRGFACGIYTVPYFLGPNEPKDHIIIGATSIMMPKPHNTVRLYALEGLMRSAMEQINRHFYRAEVVRTNVGSRPIAQDTYPLLGKTQVPNLSIISGTNRDGFHMAPVISKLVVDQILENEVDERFEWFAPDREVIREMDREAAISRNVMNQLGAMYQHDFIPPKGRFPERIEGILRADVEEVHDKVGAHDWGIPPIMIDMYKYGHAI
ncbi:NAD(P)/FAD-dependent oxidoreductase [Ruegeria arenilitoris]|uniref:NAD(P)/FAD-dependent oxidoreductase n=1 Tax=Ruegeria arenilitoris TaxID=1173585 RepID=UPI00147ABC36|nr:FAD-binding oxidoreductase [Ruegeria arenilitoris]